MKTFEVGDRVKIVEDIIDHARWVSFIGLTGTIYRTDIKEYFDFVEYYIEYDELTDEHTKYIRDMYEPYFHARELELYTDEKA